MPSSSRPFSCAYRLSPLLRGVILVFVLSMWTCGNAPDVFNDLKDEFSGQHAVSLYQKAVSPETAPKAQAPAAYEIVWALGSLGSSEQTCALAEASSHVAKLNKASPQESFTPDSGALARRRVSLSLSRTFETSPVRAASWRLPAARGLVPFAIPPPLKMLG